MAAAKTLSGVIPDDITYSTYSGRDCTSLLPPHRQTCPICARQRDLSGLNACDYAYMWSDSPTQQPRRTEKLYSQGIYGPLPCRCIPIKLKDLDQMADGSNITISTGDSGRDTTTGSQIYDVNPDVIRQETLSVKNDAPPPPAPLNEQNQQNQQQSLGDLSRTGTSTFKSDTNNLNSILDPRSTERENNYLA